MGSLQKLLLRCLAKTCAATKRIVAHWYMPCAMIQLKFGIVAMLKQNLRHTAEVRWPRNNKHSVGTPEAPSHDKDDLSRQPAESAVGRCDNVRRARQI